MEENKMLTNIDHLGIAVNDLNDSMHLYENILGLECHGQETVEDQSVNIAFYKVGDTKIELLESTCPEGPIARHINTRGQGLQHIAYRVANIEEAIADMVSKGIVMLDKTPRNGAGGSRIAFLHPKSTNGILIELCERA
jgi:methylmalonyl-CoA/ethylmalonyl-CoA epimerase